MSRNSSRLTIASLALIVTSLLVGIPSTTVSLVVLIVTSLPAVLLEPVSLVVVLLLLLLLLLVLRHKVGCPSVGLTGVEARRTRLERSSANMEATTATTTAANVQLLLCLPRQVFVLGCRVVFPRVEVGHFGGFESLNTIKEAASHTQI